MAKEIKELNIQIHCRMNFNFHLGKTDLEKEIRQ